MARSFAPARNYGTPAGFARHSAEPIRSSRDARPSGGARADEGRIVHIADVLEDPEYTFAEASELAAAFAPCLPCRCCARRTSIGVFVLDAAEVRPFTEKQIELVQTFADQAVIAIENVAAVRGSAGADAGGHRSAGVPDGDQRCPERHQPPRPPMCSQCSTSIVESAARLCEAQILLSSYRYDGELLHFVAHHGPITEESVEIVRRPFRVDLDCGCRPNGRFSILSVAQIPDLSRWIVNSPHARRGRLFRACAALLAVPMLRDGMPIGVHSSRAR